MYRKTYVKIENEKLTNNVKKIINKYNNYKYYIGVVKANAYGHGMYIVNDLIKGGINYLAVSSLEEALDIRKYNQEIPILILEPIPLEYINIAIEYKITITIDSYNYLTLLQQEKIDKQLKVHLKLDTGMHRLGIKDKSEVNAAVSIIKQIKNIYLEGIYTHLATSGVNDIHYDRAIEQFKKLTSQIDLTEIPIVHLNRSITLVHHHKLPFETGTRLGIIMFGFNQSIKEPTGLNLIKRKFILSQYGISESILENDLDLETAFSLYSHVISTRYIKKGDYVGYGANYKAEQDIYVATLPIGYYDGILKEYKYVSINNKLYEIIGDVCMDMITIKADEKVKINDQAEIFGSRIKIKDVSLRANTNAYHILTSIKNRVPRLYSDNTEIKY